MKLHHVIFSLALVSASLFADIPELKLTNGKTFRNVSVMRYDQATVTLRSSAGVGAISYALIPEPIRGIMMARRDTTKALESLVSQKKVAAGMSPDQVARSWGNPARKNQQGGKSGSSAQWVYEQPGANTIYVYFNDDEVTSWSERG